ncbi:MAG: hypothetical protein HYX91_03215 [Chloroflexi bacterium]|nr:hypothetical protein [Chloroflexota bacterium]
MEARMAILILHLIAMVFMAAPFYALTTVNERVRFYLPPNYNTDRYLENVIKRQPVRCYAYMAVILATGIWLVGARGWIWTDWALIIKLVSFALLVSLLSYIHFSIQPRIEQIIDKCHPGEDVPAADKPALMRWRSRRKRLAGVCLFLVLTAVVMGVRVTFGYAPWLAAVFLVASALFAWRAYRTPVRLGWF